MAPLLYALAARWSSEFCSQYMQSMYHPPLMLGKEICQSKQTIQRLKGAIVQHAKVCSEPMKSCTGLETLTHHSVAGAALSVAVPAAVAVHMLSVFRYFVLRRANVLS